VDQFMAKVGDAELELTISHQPPAQADGAS
jgi:hypothetical protein